MEPDVFQQARFVRARSVPLLGGARGGLVIPMFALVGVVAFPIMSTNFLATESQGPVKKTMVQT